MSINIKITDSRNAREIESDLVLSWLEGTPMTLETLIRERVLLELDKCNKNDQHGLPDFHPLVLHSDASSLSQRREQATNRALEVAFSGFRENAYFVIVDDKQIDDLQTEITLKPTSTIKFVRLIQLVGG